MSAQDSVTIRPATKEDAAFLGWVVLMAARSHLEAGFFEAELTGMSEEGIIGTLKEIIESDENSFVRWDGFLIAEVGGVPAAALSGYETKVKNGEVFDRLYQKILRERGFTESQMAEMKKSTYDIMAVWPDLHDKENHWTVEWVATKPEFRRRGLLNKLLQRVLDIGREKGYKKAQISVMIGNEPALQAYLKMGFTEYSTVTSPLISKHIKTKGIINLRMEL